MLIVGLGHLRMAVHTEIVFRDLAIESIEGRPLRGEPTSGGDIWVVARDDAFEILLGLVKIAVRVKTRIGSNAQRLVLREVINVAGHPPKGVPVRGIRRLFYFDQLIGAVVPLSRRAQRAGVSLDAAMVVRLANFVAVGVVRELRRYASRSLRRRRRRGHVPIGVEGSSGPAALGIVDRRQP